MCTGKGIVDSQKEETSHLFCVLTCIFIIDCDDMSREKNVIIAFARYWMGFPEEIKVLYFL